MLVTIQQDDTVAKGILIRNVRRQDGRPHYLIAEGYARRLGWPDAQIRYLSDDEGEAIARFGRAIKGMRLVIKNDT